MGFPLIVVDSKSGEETIAVSLSDLSHLACQQLQPELRVITMAQRPQPCTVRSFYVNTLVDPDHGERGYVVFPNSHEEISNDAPVLSPVLSLGA